MYQNTLTSDQISIAGCIVPFADVVHAISSHHPNRVNLGNEYTLEEIEPGQCTLFDGRAVNALLIS